jgi:hypothetical protein
VVDPQTVTRCFGDGFIASNSPEFRNEEEPYAFAMAADSDDDRLVGELTESDIEMLQRVFPYGRDPRVHEFSDLSLSHQANAEGRDDELLDAHEAGPSMMIEKGRVFKDLTALKRWLQHYAVLRKRPYRVLQWRLPRRQDLQRRGTCHVSSTTSLRLTYAHQKNWRRHTQPRRQW